MTKKKKERQKGKCEAETEGKKVQENAKDRVWESVGEAGEPRRRACE